MPARVGPHLTKAGSFERPAYLVQGDHGEAVHRRHRLAGLRRSKRVDVSPDSSGAVDLVLRRSAKMAFTRRGILYDALRICYVAGTPDPAQVDRVFRSADAIGIPRDEVGELQRIVAEERALQHRRYELVVVPVLPLI